MKTNEQIEAEVQARINEGIRPVHHDLARDFRSPEYFEQLWEESKLPIGVKNRLANIDQAHRGLSAVTDLLSRDEDFSNDRNDNPNQVTYSGLTSAREGLRAAQRSLLSIIGEQITEIREP